MDEEDHRALLACFASLRKRVLELEEPEELEEALLLPPPFEEAEEVLVAEGPEELEEEERSDAFFFFLKRYPGGATIYLTSEAKILSASRKSPSRRKAPMNPGWMVLFDQALSGKHARPNPQPVQQRTSSPSAPRLLHRTTGLHSASPPHGDHLEVARGAGKKKPLPPPQKPPNEGLYPDDAQAGPWYDPENGCREAEEPSYDVSGGKKVVVRSSWSESLYNDQTQCCDAVYHNADQCSAYDAATCDPLGPFTGSRQCTDGGDAPSPSDPSSGGGGKCRSTGKLICGQDCPGKQCFDQTHCIKVDGAGQTDVVYVASFEQCCVDYTNLHGEMRQRPAFDEDTGKDEVLERCKGIMERRVTDYRKQEPDGPGGYRDRGEFRRKH